MKRKLTREQVDYNTFTVKIRLEADENTSLSALDSNPRRSLIDLLNVIVHDPSQVEYGAFKPTKIELFSEGGKWILIAHIIETT